MELSSGVVKITVGTGGSGYSSAPTVSINGGGNGATAVAMMNGTAVQACLIGNAGTGYTQAPTISFSGGGGTGAAATATILGYAGTHPICMFKGRFNDMYGVDGGGRGFRWDGDTPQLEAIGIAGPPAQAVPTGATTANKRVTSIQMIDGGAGYASVPTVAFTGGSATTQASGVAILSNGRVTGIKLTDGGAGYASNPVIEFLGGQGTSAAFTVNLLGKLAGFDIPNLGAGYTGAPTVSFNNTQGLTGAQAVFNVDTTRGILTGYNIVAAGTGCTTTGCTATLAGGGATTQATITPKFTFTVDSVSIANSGSGYYDPPEVVILADKADVGGGGAVVRLSVNTAGNLTGATVYSGGAFSIPPTAVIPSSAARAVATISQPLTGKYLCCLRYLDDTPESQGGPIPSTISEPVEVDVPNGISTLTWTLNAANAEARVSAIELWRTSADQEVAFYRVAKVVKSAGVFPATFADTLSDTDLTDADRDTTIDGQTSVYGFMPLVLPSGQVNARRFIPPPENMAVACMFQDRAWYAYDTTGAKPNSLYFSEIDEPESVPTTNELIVQENAGDSDKIVALIPFGSSLLIGQRRHIYQLSYVSQPVFDAAIQLVSYRGVLNNRCWDVFAGVTFIVDDYGMYAFDGNKEEAISAPIDDYWRTGIIDFTKSKYFFVKADARERVVRFFYCRSTDGTYPSRALCYSFATQAWWEETYPQAIGHGVNASIGSQQGVVYGAQSGGFVKSGGLVDATTTGDSTAVAYSYRTPPLQLLTNDQKPGSPSEAQKSRTVTVLYTPTTNTAQLGVGVHYNNSTSPRANAIDSSRGHGFATTQNNTLATVDMALTKSALGNANGRAMACMAGRVDERSGGADRYVAIAFSGTQQLDAVKIHAVTIDGVVNVNN